jgi:hypothetical protein
MITDNKQDELIFDFLEGNMSADEAEAFRILQEESELLNRQVRLWQNTYLREPLPSVEALQQKLFIRPDNRHSGTFSARLYSLLMVVMLYVATSEDSGQKNISDMQGRIFVQKAARIANTLDTSTGIKEDFKSATHCSDIPDIKTKRIRILKPKAISVENYPSVKESLLAFDRKPKTALANTPSLTLQKATIVKNKKYPAITARKKWTRRELRLLREKLWQDQQLRNEKEYRRGRVP